MPGWAINLSIKVPEKLVLGAQCDCDLGWFGPMNGGASAPYVATSDAPPRV